jgi:hypothetical protein
MYSGVGTTNPRPTSDHHQAEPTVTLFSMMMTMTWAVLVPSCFAAVVAVVLMAFSDEVNGLRR